MDIPVALLLLYHELTSFFSLPDHRPDLDLSLGRPSRFKKKKNSIRFEEDEYSLSGRMTFPSFFLPEHVIRVRPRGVRGIGMSIDQFPPSPDVCVDSANRILSQVRGTTCGG